MTHSENEVRKALQKGLKLKAFQQKLCLQWLSDTTLLVAQKMQTKSLLVSLHQKNFMLKNCASNAQKVRKSKLTQAHQTRSDMHTQETVYNVLAESY